MSEPLTRDAFASNLNTKFQIFVDDSQTVEAELVEVTELLISARQERFAIVFRGPKEPFLGQGIRRFAHDGMEPFDLFIVPISHDEQGTNYEAVFNRLVPQAKN